MTADQGCIYVCAPAVRWVKDLHETLLVDDQSQQSWVLQGIDAAIWDLLALDYGPERIADFLAVLLTTSTNEASKRVLATIQRWEQAGILRSSGSAQGG
jgi:hypothetical protein